MRARALALALAFIATGCGGADEPRAPAGPVVPCRGVDQRLDPALARFDEQSIGAHLFRDPALIRVDRLMRQGRWTIAWSSPAGIGPGVFVIRRNGPIDEVVGSGRLAEAKTRDQVAAWAMGLEHHRPEPMPPTLARCLAEAVVR